MMPTSDRPKRTRRAGRVKPIPFLYVGCPELDALHAELCARGLAIAPPQTSTYGMRQIEVTDPDGYELCFQCPA